MFVQVQNVPDIYHSTAANKPLLLVYQESLRIKGMKTNMGKLDKILRFLLALAVALLVYYDVLQGPLSYVLMTVAVIFFLTSLTGFCPLYGLLGISSGKSKKK